MSERQSLAENSVGLCLAAMGLASGGFVAAAVPLAVLTAIGLDRWSRTDHAMRDAAIDKAIKALAANERDFAPDDLKAAADLLKSARRRIRFDPGRAAAAIGDGTLTRHLTDEIFGPGRRETETPGTIRAVELVMQAVFDTFRQNDRYRDGFTQEIVLELLREKGAELTLLGGIRDELAAMRLQIADLFAQTEAQAKRLGVQEGMLKAVAGRYAEHYPNDFEAGLRAVERALEVAAEETARGRLPANTDAAISAVLAQVETLNAAGQIDDAARLIAEEEARAAAGLSRLYDAGIAQAIQTANPAKAAGYEMKKLALEAPDPAGQMAALRAMRKTWYERGRDRGLAFDLEVTIALARQALALARDADERGTAGNDLGIALLTLGEREAGTARLIEAVAAYRAALEEWTRDRVPLQWAQAQMNLGNALARLGEREPGTARFAEAVAAYRNALEEWTRDRVPLQWARAQMNLGNVLRILGERDADTARLTEAVEAFRNALEEWPRERMPLDWAGAQMNLGAALMRLGEREAGTTRLTEAVEAFRNALEEWTRERVPLDWAMAQMNLGSALRILGEREAGTARLTEAVEAFRDTLEEWTRERMPLQWAMAQMNLGNALARLGDRETGTARLTEAVAAYRAALEEWTRERVPLDWASAQMNLGNALLTLGQREPDTARLIEAGAAYRAALEEWTRERVPLDWATAQFNLALAELALASHPTTPALLPHAERALEHVDLALQEWTAEAAPHWHKAALEARAEILTFLRPGP